MTNNAQTGISLKLKEMMSQLNMDSLFYSLNGFLSLLLNFNMKGFNLLPIKHLTLKQNLQ